MFVSLRENPERTFDLVLKVKCQASKNEGNVLCLLVFIEIRDGKKKTPCLYPALVLSNVMNCFQIGIVLENDCGYCIAF